jgi:hypothetical protein
VKVYFTENMPKTATGKVQRRLVAKAMNEISGGKQKANELISAAPGEEDNLQSSERFPGWIVTLVSSLLYWK